MSPRSSTARPNPWASLLLAAGAAAIHVFPGVARRLEVDRLAIAGGELWRLVTGHLTHWSDDHLAWDLLVFLVAGALWESRVGGRRLVAGVLASALLISLAVWFLEPEMAVYRGLSGVDNALLAALAAGSLGSALANRRRLLALATAGGLAALLCKITYELATGATLFVDTSAGVFEPVPLAHLVGGACGLVLALDSGWRASPVRAGAPSGGLEEASSENPEEHPRRVALVTGRLLLQ